MATLLELTRSDNTTKGLIDAQTDVPNSRKLFKPTELTELSLNDLGDGIIQISLVIGQTRYKLLNTEFIINGVDQSAETAAQISDTLSTLFLDSNVGGGGTVDNTTPPFLPFKSISGTFEDSTLFHSVEPVVNEFVLEGGKEEVSFQMKNDNVNGIKEIIFGNTQPVVSPYDYIQFKIDFINQFMKMVCKLIEIGGNGASSAALLQIEQNTNTVKIGDANDNNAGTKIIVDDTAGIIQLLPNGGANTKVDIDAGNQIVDSNKVAMIKNL